MLRSIQSGTSRLGRLLAVQPSRPTSRVQPVARLPGLLQVPRGLFSTAPTAVSHTISYSNFVNEIDASPINLRPLAKESSEGIVNYINEKRSKIRNLAIIAHVDHGKTTLVDSLLKAAGQGLSMERAMDHNELEQEKGITIVAKATSVLWKGHTINIIDTPGHSDFGGEVERVLSMVDAVLLVVCSTEGTMKQTKFVLQKAIMHGLKPIVVINKVDRPSSRVDEVENDIFDLFCSSTEDEKFLDYATLYTSAKKGFAVESKGDVKEESKHQTMGLILDKIIETLPAPSIDDPTAHHQNFKMLATQLDRDLIFGLYLRGKIQSGFLEVGQTLHAYDQEGNLVESAVVTKLQMNLGLEKREVNRAVAGDIVAVAGFTKARLTHTLSNSPTSQTITCPKLDPPLMVVNMLPNNSPFAGQNGAKKMSLFDLRSRLEEEAERDLALQVSVQGGNTLVIRGRGELHIGVLLERMRREGYEFQVTSPSIIFKEEAGKTLEPFELISVDIKFSYLRTMMDKIMARSGNLLESQDLPDDYQRIKFEMTSRAAIGLQSELISETNNDAKYESTFAGYQEFDPTFKRQRNSILVCATPGKVTAFGMKDLEKFGVFFIKPGQNVYKNQIIGISKDLEMDLNPCKEKRLTNIRTHEADEQIRLSPPKVLSMEDAMTFITDDEYLEVTPQGIRIRKIDLNADLRQRKSNERKTG